MAADRSVGRRSATRLLRGSIIGVIYRPIGAMRYLVIAIFAGFGLAAVALTITSIAGHGPLLIFIGLWDAVLLWNVYWWLYRLCLKVQVEAGTLEWSTFLRRGTSPVSDVTRIRASRLGRQLAVIELRDQRSLLVPVRYGYERLVKTISGSAADLVVDE